MLGAFIMHPKQPYQSHCDKDFLIHLQEYAVLPNNPDLQERCSRLIHVDLPWNPMRLHQRVGRLNRLGQHETVKVMLFLNPDTVESRIWDLLNEKLERIRHSINCVTEEPEDLHQPV